jgi:hypothetical protein
MNGRQLVAEALRVSLPRRKYRILPGPSALQSVQAGNPVVMVVRTNLEPSPHAQLGQYRQEFDIWLIEPKQLGTEAEDSLDNALEDLIAAIDGERGPGWLTWITAERSTYSLDVDPPKTHPAYRISAVGFTNRDEGA